MITIDELRNEYGNDIGFPLTPSGRYTKQYTEWLENKIIKLLATTNTKNNTCFECDEEINPNTIFFCAKCDVNNKTK